MVGDVGRWWATARVTGAGGRSPKDECGRTRLSWSRQAPRLSAIGSVRHGREIMAGSYKGACFCGAVELRVTGQPNAMGYCHCRSCRWWSGSPVNAFSLWSPEAVEVLKGA